MPRVSDHDDEWDDEPEEFDPVDRGVNDDDLEQDFLYCPSCRKPVHEETQKCPHCGDWITPVDAPSSARRFFLLALIVLLVVALIALTIR